MSNNNNRRVRRRLHVPLNLTNYRRNVKNININYHDGSTNNFPSNYTNLPREIGSFKQLETLRLTGHRLTSLPKEIGLCTNLKEIEVMYCSLESLPKEIGNLKKLEKLELEGNKLTSLPKEIGLCKNLRKIDLNDNRIKSLPKDIGNLKKLETIWVDTGLGSGQNLTSIPKEIGLCTNLKEIEFGHNKLTSIPKEIGKLKNLTELDLENNKLTSIPKEIGLCKKLTHLHFSMNDLTSIPKEIEDLPRLRLLDVEINPRLKAISSELRRNGLNIRKNNSTKFINHKYYTNQLSTVTVKRKNLPRLPPKIRENIARKVNTKPKAKTEGNKMNVARSSLRAYNTKQKVLTRRYINMLSPAFQLKNFNNGVTIRKKIHNFSKTLKNISKNNNNN